VSLLTEGINHIRWIAEIYEKSDLAAANVVKELKARL
jgi:hypothetical protein